MSEQYHTGINILTPREKTKSEMYHKYCHFFFFFLNPFILLQIFEHLLYAVYSKKWTRQIQTKSLQSTKE